MYAVGWLEAKWEHRTFGSMEVKAGGPARPSIAVFLRGYTQMGTGTRGGDVRTYDRSATIELSPDELLHIVEKAIEAQILDLSRLSCIRSHIQTAHAAAKDVQKLLRKASRKLDELVTETENASLECDEAVSNG